MLWSSVMSPHGDTDTEVSSYTGTCGLLLISLHYSEVNVPFKRPHPAPHSAGGKAEPWWFMVWGCSGAL